MDNEHERINFILEEFEKGLKKDIKKAREVFSKFNWNLEKHFFIEEKVIFIIYNRFNGDSEDIEDLLKEHKEIMWTIQKIKENMDRGIRSDVTNLKQTIKSHMKFEDEVFYPRLDEELSEQDKQLIFDRTEEIIKG